MQHTHAHARTGSGETPSVNMPALDGMHLLTRPSCTRAQPCPTLTHPCMYESPTCPHLHAHTGHASSCIKAVALRALHTWGSYQRSTSPTAVDFPEPDCPTRAHVWPAPMLRLKFLQTCTDGREGYQKLMLSNSMLPLTPPSGFRPSGFDASIFDTRSISGKTDWMAPLALPMSGKPTVDCARPMAASRMAKNAVNISSNVARPDSSSRPPNQIIRPYTLKTQNCA
mmetsp:Transcript_28510/g.84412  ORF Transcript_28510/g.84412 Transcript_28510/m.84412 type:complete len:226 (-) Transcript_28510:3370-4047(-)